MPNLKFGPLILQEEQFEPEDDANYVVEVTNVNPSRTIRIDKLHSVYDRLLYDRWKLFAMFPKPDGNIIKPGQTIKVTVRARSANPIDSGYPKKFPIKVHFELSEPLPDETTPEYMIEVVKD